ncbi:hypothetical protein D3C86_799280 [compost metagenome]
MGGAVTSANAAYLFGESQPIPCTFNPDPSCAVALSQDPSTPVYDIAANQGPQTQIGTLADYTFTGE